MNTTLRNALIALVVLLLVGGLGYYFYKNSYNMPKSTNTTVTPIANANEVVIQNFIFNPTPLTVTAGTKVTWTNNDSVPHHVKGDTFDSSVLEPGSQYSFTFTNVGTYNYICAIHTYMSGQIIVQ